MHTIWTADATDAATSAATACATAGATAAATSAAATKNDTKEVVYSNSEYRIHNIVSCKYHEICCGKQIKKAYINSHRTIFVAKNKRDKQNYELAILNSKLGMSPFSIGLMRKKLTKRFP